MQILGLSRADIAENYPVEDLSIESGDLVRIKKDQNSLTEKYVIEKTSKPYDSQIIGTVSTDPAMVLGEKGRENLRPVALIGRILTKVTTKNGDISAGDYLTSSDIPGVAMKATKPGMTIGKALESYSSTSEEIGPEGSRQGGTNGAGKIMVFVNPHFSLGSVDETSASPGGFINTLSQYVSAFFSDVLTKVENGIAYMKALVVDTLKTNSLEIGTTEQPSGITLYDELTKEPYCMLIRGGEIIKRSGKCGVVESSSGSSSENNSLAPEPAPETPLAPISETLPVTESVQSSSSIETAQIPPNELLVETPTSPAEELPSPVQEEVVPEPTPEITPELPTPTESQAGIPTPEDVGTILTP